MKSMKTLYAEASQGFNAAAQGALMQAVDSHSKAPGAQSMRKIVDLIGQLSSQTGKSMIDPVLLAQAAQKQGVNTQDVNQFVDSVLGDEDYRDEFGGYGKEVLQQTKDAMSAGSAPAKKKSFFSAA